VALLLAAAVIVAAPARADVVDKAANGFTVKTVVQITATPERTFLALADGIARWWDPAHTWSGDAKNLSLSPTPGGCFCETLPPAGSVVHATVNYLAPGHLLRMTGALGPLQEHAVVGTLTWQFDKSATGTTATVIYRVAGYFPGGFDPLAPVVDQVIGDQLRRLKSYVERTSK